MADVEKPLVTYCVVFTDIMPDRNDACRVTIEMKAPDGYYISAQTLTLEATGDVAIIKVVCHRKT